MITKIYQDTQKKKLGVKSWIFSDGLSKRSFATKGEAQNHQKEVTELDKVGHYVAAGSRASFSQAAASYEEHLNKRLHAGTISTTEHSMTCYRIHLIGAVLNSHYPNILVSEVDVLKIEKIVENLSNGFVYEKHNIKLAFKTIKNYLTNLSNFFKFCQKHKWASYNPVRETTLTEIVKKPEADSLTRIGDNVISAIIDACEDEDKLIVRFAAYTGLRVSEQRALRWSDIDLEESKVYVRRAADARNKIKPTKTKAGKRTLFLTTDLKADLLTWKAKSEYSQDDDLVFPREDGSIQNVYTWYRAIFIPAIEKSGVEKIRWHDLRHYFASKILSTFQGQIWTVTELMGHKSIDTTHRIYSHWLEDKSRDDTIRSGFEETFSGGGK